jgi:hypothetical protein
MILRSNCHSEVENFLLDHVCDGAAYFTDPDYAAAIIGTTTDGVAVYGYERMVQVLMESDGMTAEEAAEWIDYNCIGSLPYMGSQRPVIVYEERIEDKDDDNTGTGIPGAGESPGGR